MSTVPGEKAEMEATSPAPQRVSGRGRPARYTREGLLELVVGVFNERGYEGASMEDLAKASGFTKSTFYHHVSGKEELLRMAVNRALDALSAALDETVASGGSPVDVLENAIRRTTEVLLAELPYVTLLLRVRGNTKVEREALARRRAIDARLAALVKAAVDAEQIRGDIDPRLVSRLLFGMVNSITEWYRPGARTSSRTSIVDAVVGLALDGLQAHRTSSER
jgi:AcrR family transcriptional regulator